MANVTGMFSFLGRKGAAPGIAPPMPTGTRVQQLAEKGFSQQDIIKTMRAEGYSPSDVDNAMSENMRSSIGGAPMSFSRVPQERMEPYRPLTAQPPKRPAEPDYGPAPLEPLERGPYDMPEIPGDRTPPMRQQDLLPPMDEDNDIDAPYGSQQMRPAPRDIPRLPPRLESGHAMNFSNRERRQEEMEEIAEQLVEDKWKAVEVRLKSVEAKFDGFEKRMAEFEGRLGGVRADVEKKVSESEDVIENYKSDVSEITAKIGSMETVMKDTLGPMMETMRSLSETVKVLKKSHQRPASAIDMLARPSRDTYGSPSTEPDEESQ